MLKEVLQSVTIGIFTGNCRTEVHGLLDCKNFGFSSNIVCFGFGGPWVFFPQPVNRKMN